MHQLVVNQSRNLSPFITNGSYLQSLNKHNINGSEKIASCDETAVFRLPFHFEYLSLIVTALIVVRLRQKRLYRQQSWVDSLPGPRTFPIVGGLLYFSVDLKQTFKILLNWSEKYGSVFRTAGLYNEPYVFLNNAEDVQVILSSNQLGLVGKPRIPYDNIFGQFLKNGLLVSEGKYWKSHRQILSRAFTYKSFHEYTKIFNQYSKRLVNDLEKLFPNSTRENVEPKQISDLIHCCSLQIICVSVIGLDLRDNREGVLFNEKFQKYKVISSKRATYFWFLLDFFWKLHPMSREYNRIIETLNSITRKIVENRSNSRTTGNCDNTTESPCSTLSNKENNCDIGVKPRRTMIDDMLTSDMTPEEILVEANTVIAAGFESTSLTIHYMLYLLALNPEHQRACQEEVDELFNDPVMCQDENLTMDALSELKYLERCCFETLRLFPVIFMFERKLEVSLQLDEHRVLPAGTNVIIPTYTLHRNPKYFHEPEKFDPDRFLAENSQNRHPYAFIPFSGGIRNCIGYKFAIMEIKAVTAQILRHFHVSTVDDINDVPILPSVVMTPMRDYKFIFKRRNV